MTSKYNDSQETIYLICHNEGVDESLLVAHVVELAPGLTTVSGQPTLEEFTSGDAMVTRFLKLENLSHTTKTLSKLENM